MPARIVIVDAGPADPPERWIEKPFLTVGTAAGSDLLLAAVAGAEACVYVQFRDGRYEVLNKQATDVAIDGRPVAAGRSAAWEPRAELTVGGRRLRLEVDGDPTPASRPIAAAPERRHSRESAPQPAAAPAPPRPGAAPPTKGGGSGVKLAVIAACVAASAVMLLRDRLPVVRQTSAATDGFDTLVDEAYGSTAADAAADLRRRLARRLQWAEAAWRAGEWRTAGDRYAAIKRFLEGSRPAVDTPADDWRTRLEAHVDLRLDGLARRPAPN